MQTSYVDPTGAYDITYLATDKGIGCGGQLYNYAGQFSSPWYPANDRNASDCRWDISVPQNLVISITFSSKYTLKFIGMLRFDRRFCTM